MLRLFCLFIFVVSNIILYAQPTLEIWQIQGSDNTSAYEGDLVRTEQNVVTQVLDDIFFIQTPDTRSDMNRSTSDGILVVEEKHGFQVGDLVTVEARVLESNNGNTFLEVQDTPSQLVSSDQPLPTPTLVTSDYPVAAAATVSAWEWLEGMLVSLDNFTLCEASNDYSAGFVTPLPQRPFREAGIRGGTDASLPMWDGNPEAIPFVPPVFGLSDSPNLGAGMQLRGNGIVLQEDDFYFLAPISYITIGDYLYKTARPKNEMEASFGCINSLFFEKDDSAYAFRLEKMVRYIQESLQVPDIIAFQEVGSLRVLEEVATLLQQADTTQQYTAYFRQGSGFIHTGYLVKNTVSGVEIEQLGENESLSIGGRVHDRPPLLLTGQLNTNPPTPFAMLNVHIRSLNGIEGSDQNFVRTKRHEQAVSIARMVKALQTQYDNIFLLGDFNAFQFSDGYVDVVNQITGQASLGSQFPVEPIVETPLVNRSLEIPLSEQYSYVFNGSSQILDHCLSSRDLVQMQFDTLIYTRGNADSPETFLTSDPVLRVSDHDGFVVYFDLEDSLSVVAPPTVNPFDIDLWFPNPFVSGNHLHFNLKTKENLNYALYTLHGVLVQQGKWQGVQQEAIPLKVPAALSDGLYFLKIQGSTSDIIEKIWISSP